MSKYLVIPRRPDSPVTHAGGSTEEAVCEIAKSLLHFPGPAAYFMAIPADTKVATFAVLKEDALCSIEVTKKTLETWRQDVANIQAAINAFQSAKDHAENVLDWIKQLFFCKFRELVLRRCAHAAVQGFIVR